MKRFASDSATWRTRATGLAAVGLLALGAVTAQAQTATGAPGATAAGSAAAPTTAKAEAEVRRVEAATGRVQLRHGPIANLDMPPMTMVFRVKSPALLEGLKEGDRILFTAEKIDGAYTVTSVEKRP